MAKAKAPPHAAVPIRAFSDARLSGQALRVLICICFHDRFSLTRGGPGCYASNQTLSREIGCDYASLSRTISQLVDQGYLLKERGRGKEFRNTVYRVVYIDADSQFAGSQTDAAKSLCSECGENDQSICKCIRENGRKLPKPNAEYTPLRGVRDNSEELERDTLESARFEKSRVAVDEVQNRTVTAAGQIARLERALTAGEPVNFQGWHDWLNDFIENYDLDDDDEKTLFRAQRVQDVISERLYADAF